MAAEIPERVFYAGWQIRAFRSVERFSDYKKIKARLLRTLETEHGAKTPRGRMRSWWSAVSDKEWVAIAGICGIVLVLLTVALLMVALL